MRVGRALLLAVSLAVVGCGPDYPPTAEGLYMAKCSRCHEADGSSLTASAQADRDVDLRNGFFQRSTDDGELKQIMEFGKGRMQGVTDLNAATMDSIVLHVRRLGGSPQWRLDTAPSSE